MQIAAYTTYLLLTAYITIHVGWLCYRSGEAYIRFVLPRDPNIVKVLNRLLLTGYYLLNLGYCARCLQRWPQIHDLRELVEVVGFHTGRIVLTLAIMHLLNMAWILALPWITKKFHLKTGTED